MSDLFLHLMWNNKQKIKWKKKQRFYVEHHCYVDEHKNYEHKYYAVTQHDSKIRPDLGEKYELILTYLLALRQEI